MNVQLLQPNKPCDPACHDQLVIYAREIGDLFREQGRLSQALMEREQQIRELKAAAIASQEEERQWIAIEVHDRIAQTLAAAFQQLQILESLTHDEAEARQVAVRASALLRQAIREARNIMNDLHPPILDEFGVVPLVEDELWRFRDDTGCTVVLDADHRRRPRDVEMALYRIFHEALVNIRRHAPSAGAVNVSLTSSASGTRLQIEDDGPGFDAARAIRDKKVGGIMSMQRRAELVSGSLDINSKPGSGTTVEAYVPWPKRRRVDRT